MKKVAVKLITISSQILVVGLFLVTFFSGNNTSNNEMITVSNNNFYKMADLTSILFENEDMLVNTIPTDVVIPFEEEITEVELDEVVVEEQEEVIEEETEESDITDNVTSLEPAVLQTVVGNLTGYGADCVGCSGITSSGYDIRNTIYYDDPEYGTIRIVAADPSFPFYSIFRISNVPGMEPFIVIVLDRGSNVGFGRGTLFDLAYLSEEDPNLVGLTRNVTFELLRSGK